jgi:hypothetical protein
MIAGQNQVNAAVQSRVIIDAPPIQEETLIVGKSQPRSTTHAWYHRWTYRDRAWEQLKVKWEYRDRFSGTSNHFHW